MASCQGVLFTRDSLQLEQDPSTSGLSLFHLIYTIPRLRTSDFVAKFHCVCNMSLKTYSSRVTVMFATKSSKRSSSYRTYSFYRRFFSIKHYPEPHSLAVYLS